MFESKAIRLAEELIQAILEKNPDEALKCSKNLLNEIFGKKFCNEIDHNGILRYNSLKGPRDSIKYWGLLYEGASKSGVYENFSLVAFPDNQDQSEKILLCFGIGTGGITDDAELLNIPGVKRSVKSLLKFLDKQNWLTNNTRFFVKDELADESTNFPKEIISELDSFSEYDSLWNKYGKYLPSACVIENKDDCAEAFLSHILLYGKIREWNTLKKYREILENKLLPELMDLWRKYPNKEEITQHIKSRKYIILQGPPGTGKTHLAEEIAHELKENTIIDDLETIQFHSSYMYEDFVEGIRPNTQNEELTFIDNVGPLIRTINKAKQSKNGFLLVVDEINRGDIAKILGEAIFLFEPMQKRKVVLKSGEEIEMPDNFYLIGTMNTADRTIAILDFAIRRRFAFIDVWPSNKQLQKIYNEESELSKEALRYYNRIERIFYDYATEDDLNLQPGHTYFISDNSADLKRRMKYEIAPLLKEYLSEGRLIFAKNELQAIIEEFEDV